MAIQLVEGKKFYVRDGKDQYPVTVSRNSLPRYNWSMKTGPDWLSSEVWMDDGTAYHDDCGFNIVGEIKITSVVDKLWSGAEVMYFSSSRRFSISHGWCMADARGRIQGSISRFYPLSGKQSRQTWSNPVR